MKFNILLLFIFSLNYLYSEDYYWIGDSGEWDNPENWSLSSGGKSSLNIPTNTDNVIFDDHSFKNDKAIIKFTNAELNQFIFSSSKTVSFIGETMIIHSNFELKSNVNIKANLIFESQTKDVLLINTGGYSLNSNFIIESGYWILKNHLITSNKNFIEINNSTFNSNQKSIYTGRLKIINSKTNLENSALIGVDLINLEGASKVGGNPIIYTNGGQSIIKPGKYDDSQNKDQTVNCSGGLVLNLNITADYNGQNISCNGACDGELTIIASGTAGPYGYKFNNTGSFTTQTVFGSLCAGTYSVTVIDSSQQLAPGVYVQCTISEQISEPPVITFGVLGVVQPSCPGVCDGQAFTNAFGGTGTLVITWPNSGEITANPVGLCVGINPVTIVDDNGCNENDQVLITDPPKIDFDVTITHPTCNGDSDAQIFISNETGGNGGPYTYSYNPVPANGQGSNPATGYSAGNVVISVFDVDGCQQDSTVTIINPPILNASTINPQAVSCFGICDGQITALPSGGVAPYTYEWFDNSTGLSTGLTDSIPNNFCSGNYYVIVTDAVGCQATSNVAFVGTPTQILANAQVYQMSCFGVCDGALDVDPSGGTPPYTYNWTTIPGGSGVGATDSLSGMCQGQYQIIVTDFNGCSSTPDTLEIIEPPQLTLSLNGTDPDCYDICNGVINAVVGGGTPGFSYNWIPNPPVGQGTPNISNLCGAVQYDLTVTDTNGCMISDNLTLNNPVSYDVTTAQTNLQCFGDVNGSISVTVNQGGNGGPYTYDWAPGNPTGDGTPNVSNLSAGNYSVTISDGVMCDTILTFTITEPSQLTANASVISNVNCNGECNGSAQVVINGGMPNYSILWNDPANQSTNVASGLCVGNYTVNITDANGCTANDNVSISEPAQFNFSVSQTDLTCFNDCSVGSATVTINSGGTPPYSILWDDPSNQNTFTATNLCAGTYHATITDANLCDSVLTFVINEPAELTVAVNSINSACFGTCTGSASLTVNGGTGTYNYEWYDAATNVPLGINNSSTGAVLCPGDYYAIVTDASGCSTTSSTFTIIEQPNIITNLVSSTDASCGACNGQGEVSASGGAGSFTYNWTPAPGGGQGTTIGTGLCAGVYNVQVTDISGCTSSQAVTINSVALEVLNLDSVDVTCYGLSDGQAIANYVCLQPPCQIEWFDLGTGLSTGIIGDATPNVLSAGTYIALLTNNLGCVTSDTITVNSPPQINLSVTPTDVNCFNACDGSAVATASGGTGTLNYTWNPLPGTGQNTPNAGGLCAGNWDITITDANGCTENVAFVINQPNDISIDNVSATDISCFGVNDGTVSVLSSGGTGTQTYEWFLCGTNTSIGNGANLNNLPPGDYYVVVTDGNGCTKTSNCVTVDNQVQLTAIINSTNSGCYGYCDGIIDVVASGGNGIYFYQWLDASQNPIAGQTNDTLSNICQGTYYVDVTDGNGCSITQGPINMTQPTDPWSASITGTNIDCNGANNGTATVTVLAGNNPPYTYLWDDPLNQTTPTAVNLAPGTYNVTVFDAGICDTTLTITITEAPAFNLSGTQTNILCNGDCTGIASVNPSGGVAPYTINWSNGDIGNSVSNLCVGSITATIVDNNGCSLDTTFNITEPSSPLTTNTVFSNPSSCGLCNGSATINVVGGTPSYTYVWTGNPIGQGTNNVSGLCSGVISVTVTDANNCSISEVYNITDINGETLDTTHTDVTCFGTCDGTAEVIYTCSDPGCTQEWFDATTGLSTGVTSTSINNLCAGDYIVQVTNNSMCVSSVTVTINEPTQIQANETITPISCNGANDASITVTPTGGSGSGYTYNWIPIPPNGNGTNTATPIGPGLWSVEITDGTGCIDTIDFNLTEPTPIIITPVFNDITCNGANNGSISITVSGGSGTYTYQWFMNGSPMAGETSPNIINLAPGNYNVQVNDGACTVSMNNDITVSQPFSIVAPITSTDITCNGSSDGTATVTPSGGTPPYIINWYDASTNTLIGQTGSSATNLQAGDYYAVITDVNSCTFTSNTVTISENPALTYTLNSTDANCFGVCDGTASIVVNGGQLPYTYIWLDVLNNPIPGASGANVSNLCAGNYSIEVIDANNCTIGEQDFVINGFQPITANLFSNNATCGLSDGTATVNPNGGNPGYTYQWLDNLQNPIPGETNQNLVNAPAGDYYVDVIDVNGCTERFNITISNAPSTTLTWDNITNPTCFGGNDGAIECTVTGVAMPLTFVWNPGGLVTEDIYGLSAGTYTLQVTDANGCLNTYDTTLIDPTEITITPTVNNSDCNLCNGDVSVFLNGGTGVLTTVWNNGATGTFINQLCPNVYEVTVTDGAGCSQTDQITIGNTSGFTANAIVTAISCQNACDGVININTSGGTAPFTYNWLNYNNSTNSSENNLCFGTYFVEVFDSIGCEYPLQVDLLNPNPQIVATETINPPTCGNADGTISVVSSGGNLPHTYLWNTGANTPAITNIDAGIYTVTITDANGCSEDFVFTVNNTTAPEITLTPTDLLCNGDCSIGQITSIVTGGTPNYLYQWLDATGNPIGGETNPDILNTCAGTYYLQVTDNVGCIVITESEIQEPDAIILNSPFTTQISCNGTCDGTITVNPIGGTPTYTFAWDDPSNQTTVSATGLCAGTYNVTITDGNGCTATQSDNLIDPLPIQLVLDSIVDATCVNSSDGGIYISIIGGSPPLTIGWTTDGKDTTYTEDLTDTLPGSYIVSITDINGCTLVDTFNIDTLLTVLAFAGNDTIICFNSSVVLNGTSNQTNADFTWYDINGNQISDTSIVSINAVNPGSNQYILEASYANCSYTDTITVTTSTQVFVDAGLDIEMLSSETEVIGGNPTASTGTTILWKPTTYLSDSTLANPSVIKPQEDITYVVTVTDTLGCSNSDTVYVEVIPSLIIPDGISPNGDGKNETWVLVFKNDFPEMEVSVYNRWGELLFYDNNGYANAWDGKYKGEDLPVGTYYYVIDVHNELYPDAFTGPITIMR
jgi:gliding motility-associated-like protein